MNTIQSNSNFWLLLEKSDETRVSNSFDGYDDSTGEIYNYDSLVANHLNLSENDSILEIGTGWGSFAIHAAKNYGCNITTTTISDAQYDYAKNKIFEEGLDDKITLLNQDYRNLTGTFDKIVSIEMIEAVGHEYVPLFFQKVYR